jgi:phosphoribosylamine---glycine ligase
VRVLVVGGGAREHAIAWKLARSGEIEELYAAPGNPGIAGVAHCVPIAADSTVELAEFAASLRVDLTVVGPELPLVLGVADEFERRGLSIAGPSRSAAELEGSKVFTKAFCDRHGIPTGRARVVHDRHEAAVALKEIGVPAVLKADGLAAGKGVLVCRSRGEIDAALVRFFEDRAFGAAGDRVLVEEFLAGEEVSFMALTDGNTVLPLAAARDYKRLSDGDEGPNTGGMGAICPTSISSELAHEILRTIVLPTVTGMAAEGRSYRGVLYAGVMATPDGPKLLEFNCRFGDPEAQVVLPRLDDDLLPLLMATARGELSGVRASWRREAAVCVTLAAAGYPLTVRRGDPIMGVAEALALPGALVFHAGTSLAESRLVTAGGRVLSVVGRGATIADATRTAYDAVGRIAFDGMQHRRDVGERTP